MKPFFLIITAALFAAFTSCNNGAPVSESQKPIIKHLAQTKQYTCPMDTEVVTSKPGTCPKCGMDLVEKDNE